MKNLKFRVWFPIEKNYIRHPSIHISLDGPATIPYGNELEPLITEDYKIEQFTGFKCKNGDEIYEGDIVGCGNFKVEIIYDDMNGCFSIKNQEISFDDGDLLSDFYDVFEKVIGNINENPELMNE